MTILQTIQDIFNPNNETIRAAGKQFIDDNIFLIAPITSELSLIEIILNNDLEKIFKFNHTDINENFFTFDKCLKMDYYIPNLQRNGSDFLYAFKVVLYNNYVISLDIVGNCDDIEKKTNLILLKNIVYSIYQECLSNYTSISIAACIFGTIVFAINSKDVSFIPIRKPSIYLFLDFTLTLFFFMVFVLVLVLVFLFFLVPPNCPDFICFGIKFCSFFFIFKYTLFKS